VKFNSDSRELKISLEVCITNSIAIFTYW